MPIITMVEISAQNVMILIATAISPAIMAFLFHLVIKKSKHWANLNFWVQQLLISAFFFALTICSIHFGVKFLPAEETGELVIGEGAIVKTFGSANASPMIAGLVFGWPAGLITGFLGGLYRCFINPFGVNDFIRAAEAITIFLSGALSALLRKGLFDNKKPKWGYGIIIGVLIETIHMIMIFITGMIQRNVNFAYAIIRQCDIACALVVTFAIVAALLSISIAERESIGIKLRDNKISTKVQRWMMASFIVAMLGASLLTYFVVSTQASVETHQTLENAARDVVYEIETSQWGSENGWNNHNVITPGPTPEEDEYIDELKPIAYTRRIRTNGFIAVLGGNYYRDEEHGVPYPTPDDPDNKIYSPMEIRPDQIYSVSADLDQYREKGFQLYFYDPNTGKQDPIPPHDDSRFTTTVDINIQYAIPALEQFKTHKATTMFQIILHTPKEGGGYIEWKYMIVMIRACVTGPDDKTITQEFNVVAFMSQYEARATMGMSLRISIYIELLIFIAVYCVIYIFIKRAVVNNIQKINNSLEKITEGDLSIKVNVRSNAEFASLSDDINHTVDTLKHYIDEAQKRMEQELVFAKSIQQGTLPYIFPNTINFDLFADMKTAKQVGGDFYDFFPLSNNRLFFLIADVSGKGVPAAMFMMRAETLIKSLVQTDEMSLDKVMATVNNELCNNNEAQMFVTCWCAILDINTGHVDFVNAGHNAPIIKRKGGKFEEIKITKNFVLAGLENIPYRLESFDLKAGDEVFIYTDGVTEATDKSKRLYGIERLLKFMNEYQYHTSNEMIKGIMGQLDDFQKDVDQFDDITMLMIRYKPE
ncbi:MAG: SpoIIE family protein phosphatase [Bacilli bacterium]|nr:SpoIIE family protein phosphatase [Bacilli bacterium]